MERQTVYQLACGESFCNYVSVMEHCEYTCEHDDISCSGFQKPMEIQEIIFDE